MKHVEMIIDYLENEEDFQYFDNKGTLVRCKDCKHYNTHDHRCKVWNHGVVVMDYCSKGEKK